MFKPINGSKKLHSFSDINLDVLKELLSKGFPKVKRVAGKDMVMIVGNTGAGKSTLTNYLMGCEMELKFMPKYAKHCVIAKDPVAEIGHTVVSQTLYPEAYSSNKEKSSAYVIADFPGFDGNRGKAHSICESVCSEWAIKSAKSLKAIIVAIDYNEFMVTKGKGFSDLSKTLSRLIEDPDAISDSIFFVVNKAPRDVAKQDLEEALRFHLIPNLKKQIKKQISGHKSIASRLYSGIKGVVGSSDNEKNKLERSEIQDLEGRLKVVELIDRYSSNLIVSNVLDGNDFKEELDQLIQKSKDVKCEAFNFNNYDDSRKEFNQLIYDLANDGSQIVRQLMEVPFRISEAQRRISESEERIQYYELELTRLESGDVKFDQYQEDLESLNRSLIKNTNALSAEREKLRELNKQIQVLQDERNDLDTDDPVKYRTHSMKEDREFLGHLFSWTDKSYSYNDIPFIRVDKTHDIKQGKFQDEVNQPSQGKYSVRYVSNWGHGSTAQVSVYVENRLKPDNVKRIEAIDTELADKYSQRTSLENYIAELEKENESFQVVIDLIHAGNNAAKEDLERAVENIRASIRRTESDIEKTRIEIGEMKELLAEREEVFAENRDLLQFAYDFVKAVPFDSALVKEFVKQFERYLSIAELVLVKEEDEIKAQEETYLSGSENELEEAVVDNYFEPEEFCCPIGRNVMDDPVVLTVCGHTFDRKNIWTYFNHKGSDEVDCPECRVPVRELRWVTNYKLAEAITHWRADQQISMNINAHPTVPETEEEIEKLNNTIKEGEDELESLKLKIERLEYLQAERHSCLSEGLEKLKEEKSTEKTEENEKAEGECLNSLPGQGSLSARVGSRSGSPIHQPLMNNNNLYEQDDIPRADLN